MFGENLKYQNLSFLPKYLIKINQDESEQIVNRGNEALIDLKMKIQIKKAILMRISLTLINNKLGT